MEWYKLEDTMSNPLPIQLAIQGGGAKIYALMAAAEALQALQRKDAIKVTKVAGTSAGAIIGALFAAGVDMAIVRARIQGLRLEDIQELFPELGRLRTLWRLSRGRPIWDISRVESFLQQLFKDAGNLDTFQDIENATKVEVRVVAADLTESKRTVYKGNDRIIGSLLSSCGLPYFFRIWGRTGGSVIVDGGICENLPFDELDPDTETYGPVVAISFGRPERRNVHNIVEFSKALLETAMENSMERSRTRLGQGSVFSVEPVKVGTFDFALAHGAIAERGGNYELIRERAKEFFTDFIDRLHTVEQVKAGKRVNQVLVGDPWKTQSLAMLDQLAKVYQAYQNDKCNYSSCSVVVKARCLLADSDPEYGQPDWVHYSMEFNTLDAPIFCHSVVLSSSSNAGFTTSLERTSWMILDLRNDRQIRAIDLPMRSPGDNVRELLLFLDPILPSRSGPYSFDFQDLVQDFMKPLRDTGKDELVFTPRRAEGTIDSIDLVLWVPLHCADGVRMWAKTEGNGRLMTKTELGTPLYVPPPGFRAIGWRGENLTANQPFGVDVQV